MAQPNDEAEPDRRDETITAPQGTSFMMKLFSRFQKNESGATAIEYGLLAALIGVGIIAGAGALGTSLNNKFTSIGNTITTGAPAATK